MDRSDRPHCARPPTRGQDDDPQLDYAAEELVADSVAHTAVSFVRLNSSSASAVPYLTSWAESAARATFQQVALVDRLSRRLEDALGAGTDEPAPAALAQRAARA